MYSGMIWLLLPVSTVYGTIILFGPSDVFKFTVSMEQFLLKWIELMLTESMLFSSTLSWTASCSTSFMTLALLLLHIALKCPILLHSVHVFPYAGHCLGRWLLPQCLHICFVGIVVCMCFPGLPLCVCFSFIIFSLSNSFGSMRLFMLVDGAFCTLTLFAQNNTFLLMIFFKFSFIFVSSWIISPYTLLQIVTIYACIIQHFHPFCLLNLGNCSDFIVSLNWSLNILVNILNNPSNMLHVSFSTLVNNSTNCRSFLPSKFFTIASCSL